MMLVTYLENLLVLAVARADSDSESMAIAVVQFAWML